MHETIEEIAGMILPDLESQWEILKNTPVPHRFKQAYTARLIDFCQSRDICAMLGAQYSRMNEEDMLRLRILAYRTVEKEKV